MGSGCIDPRFLDLGTSWREVVSFTPLPEKMSTVFGRLSRTQNRSGYGEGKILDAAGTRNPTAASRRTDYAVVALEQIYVSKDEQMV
jgi:hypothetical protein